MKKPTSQSLDFRSNFWGSVQFRVEFCNWGRACFCTFTCYLQKLSGIALTNARVQISSGKQKKDYRLIAFFVLAEKERFSSATARPLFFASFTLFICKNYRVSRLRRSSSNQFHRNKKRLSTDSLFCFGGEGLCLPNCKFFFTIPVTIEMILYRSREIEDLLHINNVPF